MLLNVLFLERCVLSGRQCEACELVLVCTYVRACSVAYVVCFEAANDELVRGLQRVRRAVPDMRASLTWATHRLRTLHTVTHNTALSIVTGSIVNVSCIARAYDVTRALTW